MNKKFKILCLLLSFVMCISLFPSIAGAEEPLTKTVNKNVALNKYVYSSDGNAGPSGKIQVLTDGRKNTDYTFYPAFTHITYNGTLNEYSGVLPSGEVGEKATSGDKTWYMIDLGRKYNITDVRLYAHSTWPETNAIGATSRYMSNVEVQVSNTEDFAQFERVIDIEAATWDDFPYAESDFDGKKAYRYVRVKKTSNTEHGYSELEVFADVTLTEVSRNKDVTANVVSYDSYPAEEVNDGLIEGGNGWLVESGTAPYYLTVDLGEEYPVSWIEMFGRVIDPDNPSTRESWKIYGSDTEPDADTIEDGESLITALFSGYDGNRDILFPHYSKGGYSAPVLSSAAGKSYRYITFYKTAYNVALSEVRAFVINPEVIASEVKDNAVYLEFSEEMDSPEDYIVVYNSTDKEEVSNPSIETLADGRIKVSTPGLFSKEILVTVEEDAPNMKGVPLGIPQIFNYKTPSALTATGFEADGIKLLDAEKNETSLSSAKTAKMKLELSNASDDAIVVTLILGVYDANDNLLACASEMVAVTDEDSLSLNISLNGLSGADNVKAFLIDDFSTLGAWSPSVIKK